MEEHLAKGTSVRARQEWDITGEGPGKILLKCEGKYGQQKYMQYNYKKLKGGNNKYYNRTKNVQEEIANFC